MAWTFLKAFCRAWNRQHEIMQATFMLFFWDFLAKKQHKSNI